MLLKIFILLIIIAIILKLFVMFYEHNMIFFPDHNISVFPENLKYEDIYFTNSEGIKLNGWFFPAASNEVILFCHGNGGNISHNISFIQFIYSLGYSIFIIDYRNYGNSAKIKPDEAGIYNDGEAAYNYLIKEKKYKPEEIILWGHSLGTTVVSYIADKYQCKCLILESPFTNAVDMSKIIIPFLPLKYFMRVKFNNLERVKRIDVPKLIIHGTIDETIPFSLGKKLYENAKEPKEFYIIENAGHNNIYQIGGIEYLKKIKNFIEREKNNE
ncbi:MAG TPA: alpha/beta hydrolase [bacterium]|nr:alpha/beta hydrolase [bacterium]HOL48195.1 alpha/beta hydrolase [bacterium]HPQ19604.1 alpha/beta hydrolase [bacterium]